MRLLLYLILGFLPSALMAQHTQQWVTVKGHAPAYAGYDLVMRQVVNPISMEEADLMVIRVNEQGHFEQGIELTEVTPASIDMGKYRGHIFLEPGKTYQLMLPPFSPRSDAERFNPYFVPKDIDLGIVNTEAQALNRCLGEFDNELNTLYNANAVRIFSHSDVSLAKSLIQEIDSTQTCSHPYFIRYKQYAYGELLMLAHKRNKRKAIYQTFKGDSLNFLMPSFRRTFTSYFKSFFNYYFSTAKGEPLREAFANRARFDTLSMLFRTDTLFANPELAELVLLKGSYDGFYSGRYNQEAIIRIFQQASQYGCTQKIREIAAGLYARVTWLRVGSDAPPFTLYRLDGKERSLSDYEGKFVYLNFMHTSNHACKEDLQLLNILHKQLKRELTIVTVIMDEDPSVAEQMVKDNKFRWDFLHYGAMPKVALDYRIKALPSYYVIDPNQKLRLSPAPSPKESFVPIFLDAQRNYRYEELRKEQPGQKSIYDL
ncbi:TlpA family protein disulfide reductase [Carboxylicivirga taeanensis]|uniref:TlpA family protein disulfide reductase n=1 Tax=Carboxylicivirga taeanensis TaxID=1416875 RepID=UPI003F6DFFF1